MKYIFMVVLLVLSACAHDVYSVTPNSSGSKDKMAGDLKECKHEAVDKYFAAKTPINPVGLIASGILGGAVGGAAFGAAMSTEQPKNDIDREVETCMYQKGYMGTSGTR